MLWTLGAEEELTQEHCTRIVRTSARAKNHDAYLKATKTVSAFCACVPNTFRKNRLATVTPECWISSLVAALRIICQHALPSCELAETHAKYATFASR